MGLLDGLKAMKAAQTIKNGGEADLSYAMLVSILINLPDAKKKLTDAQFREVHSLYNKFQTCTTKMHMNQDAYLSACLEIIGKFDEIAPYQLYSGGSEFETSLMMDEVRKAKSEKSISDYNSKRSDYVDYVISEFKKFAGFSLREEKVAELIDILNDFDKVGKEETLRRFDENLTKAMPYILIDGRTPEGEPENVVEVTRKVIFDSNLIASFFCGLLNANGIVDEDESRRLTDKYCDHLDEYIKPDAKKNPDIIDYYENALYFKDINKEYSFDMMEKAAERGIVEAQEYLADKYFWGKEVPKDEEKAMYYLKLCAEKDNAASMYYIGRLYLFGENIERDDEKGVLWLEKAADRDVTRAFTDLGMLYLNGNHVSRNVEKGLKYLNIAVEKEDPHAFYCLARVYAKGKDVPFDEEKARYWFNKALELNPGYKENEANFNALLEKGRNR